jgi:hypothetical protein
MAEAHLVLPAAVAECKAALGSTTEATLSCINSWSRSKSMALCLSYSETIRNHFITEYNEKVEMAMLERDCLRMHPAPAPTVSTTP